MKTRTGIFGGSFDPVHTGHLALARSFLNSGLIHHLLVLLTPDPPHKQSRKGTSYDDRLEMLRIAFDEFSDDVITISTIECDLPRPSYTLQTIDYLREHYPNTLFYLCMGEDSLVNFHKWFRYKDIMERVNLIVAERPGYDRQSVSDEIMEHVMIIGHEPVDASSTKVRKKYGEKENGLDSDVQLPEGVRRYIEENGLYQEE